MALTDIADQRTPGRPVSVTFAAETGLPSANQEVLLIGHKDAASGTIAAYAVTTISNSGDLTAGKAEAEAKFGAGSELAKMVEAAILANSGASTLPQLKCIPLAYADVGFGASDDALVTARKVKAEFIVSPYDGTETSLRNKLKVHVALVSGAQRVENNQFGTIGVVANYDETDPSLLPKFDTQYVSGFWLRDTGSPAYSLGELAAACAAKMAGNAVPFNPQDSVTLVGVDAPADSSDYITVGAGLESEACLGQGWTPLYVKPNTEVAFVRTVTGRMSPDGSGTPVVTSYYDVQDFMVLYFFRKTIWTRFSQSDFKQAKASDEKALLARSEAIRLASAFEDAGMFQKVQQLSKLFQVERSITDRHRFDVKIPVNVIPGLHVIATNIEATTQYDIITI